MLDLLDIILIGAVTFCVFTDVVYGKIKNYITFPLIGIGLGFNIYSNGLNGALFSIKGLLVCGLLALILFSLNGLGMGDVKLFMAIGSIKGIWFGLGVIISSFFSLVIFSLLFRPRKFLKAIKNIYEMSKGILYKNPYKITEKESALVVAYAVYIMCGLVLTYIIGGDISWSSLFAN